jgi:hypothetical protein
MINKVSRLEITLTDLNVDIEYHYQKPVFGGSYADTGDQEILPAEVDIYSVKCKGIELISLLEPDQLSEMNEKLLEQIKAQDA